MVIRRAQRHSLHFLFLLAVVATTQASVTNRTIDDLDGDSATGAKPQYAPSIGWNQGSQCPGCAVQLDSNEVFHATWMDGTVPADDTTEPFTITMSFHGTAIYVFNALANTIPGARTDQNITFFIDGQQANTFVHAATSSTDIDYRVLVFSQDGLENAQHTLVVQPEPNSNILFDFAMYTFDDGADATSTTTTDSSSAPTPTNNSQAVAASSASNVTTIVPAVVVGVVALIAIVAALVFLLRRRRRRRRARSGPRLILDADLEDPYEKPEGPEHTGTAGHGVPGLTTTGIPDTGIPSAGGAPVNANSGHGAPHTYTSLASPPLSLPSSKRSPGVPAEPGNTLQTELAALREEVARLRQEHEQAGTQSSVPPSSTAESRPSLPEKARHRGDAAARGEGSELAALREEVRRLRARGGTVSEVLSPSDDAPPRYEG